MAGAGYKLFNTGDVLTAAQVNTYLQEQVVMVFANATARTTALNGVLAEGMVSYLKDTDAIEVYNGSAWVSTATGDITGVTTGATSGLTGGVTSGTADLKLNTTAKGGLLVGTGSGTVTELAVGTNNQTIIADSAATSGLKYAASLQSTLTTTGDLVYASGANTPSRLGIGSSGQVLTVSSGVPAWTTPSSSTLPTFSAYADADQTQTANVWTKKTFAVEEWDTANNFASSRFTPTTAGYYQVSAGLYANDSGTLGLAFYKNGAEWKGQAWAGSGSNFRCQLTALIYLNGSTDYVEVFSRSSTGTLYNGAGSVWFQGIGIRS